MPDNWNKLADLLGTPSINPIERKSSPAKTPARSSEPAAAARVSLEPDIESNADSTVEQTFESSATLDDVAITAPVPEPEPKSKFKSTWDAVAEFFGVAPPERESSEPVAETSPPPATKSSFWSRGDNSSSQGRSSQQVSDELLGRKGAAPEDPDLDALLSGFRVQPAESRQKEPASAPVPETPARGEFLSRSERTGRSPERSSRLSERGSRQPARGRRELADEEPPRARREFTDEEPPRSAPDSRRRKTARVDMPPEREVDPEIGADRRGPRRRPRRDQVDTDQPRSSENVRREGADDSTVDHTRRGQRRSVRGDRTRNIELSRSEPEIRSDTPRSRTSAWDDPELQNDVRSDDDRFNEALRERGEGEGPRRRRRRRRPTQDDHASEDDTLASTGRQIYGRHADEEEGGLDTVESMSTTTVVPWVEAISGIIDKNMKNHRHSSSGPRNSRGSGGNRGGRDRDSRR